MDMMSNQLFEMSKADIWNRKQRRSRVLNTSWRTIPHTSSFEICLASYNIILELVGLPRRLPNQMIFRPHQNKSMNKYMRHQLLRMQVALEKKEIRKFWFLAQFCMKYSVSFRVSAINAVFRNWYKLMPLSFIININAKADKILRKGLDDLEYKRVYIPKDPELFREVSQNREEYNKRGGRWRPLGVPKHAWRLVLHMWNNFLTMFLDEYLGDRQHAYRPRLGCVTAWKMLVEKMNKYRNIYEIDLTNCFNEIQAQWVTDVLLKLGMPPAPVYWLENINRCTPKFAEHDEIDETVLRDRSLFRNLGRIEKEQPYSLFQAFNEMEPENQQVVLEMAKEEGMDLSEFIQLQWALLDQYTPSSVGHSHRGLAQGCNTSPILTAAVLREFTEQLDSVFYADDGIFFSDKPIEIKDDPDKGIKINRSKSAMVKKDGVWLKELKFLGLKYNPWTDQISGHTRNGSRLEFDSKREDLHVMLEHLAPSEWSMGESKWERLFKSTLSGSVMSKLYNATWEELEYIIRWKPFGVKQSWLDIKGLTDNFKTTSSDACAALSYIVRNKIGHVRSSAASSRFVEFEREANKRSWRAYRINGRWIRRKVKEERKSPTE